MEVVYMLVVDMVDVDMVRKDLGYVMFCYKVIVNYLFFFCKQNRFIDFNICESVIYIYQIEICLKLNFILFFYFRFIKLIEIFYDWMVFKECVLNKNYLLAFFFYLYDFFYW